MDHVAELKRIVARDPNDFAATIGLAALLLQHGNLSEAEWHARNAVRMHPQSAQSNYLLGMILTEGNRPRPGEFHYRRALALSRSRDPIMLANLAWNLKNQGRVPEARVLYREATATGPGVFQTLLGFACLEEADGEFGAATNLLDRCDALQPGNSRALLLRATIHSRTGCPVQAIATLDSIVDAREEGALRPEEWLQRGHVLDRIGRYDEAFAAFMHGKALMRQMSGLAYLADEARDEAERVRRFFTAERMKILPRATAGSGPQPIFVAGFPRSGTTLIEQMLSAHSRVSAGDELPFIRELTEIMPQLLASPLSYPDALSELWMGDHRYGLDDLRDHYLRQAAREGFIQPGTDWFTDKMPLNETHLGLITLLFPKSPIVHMIRHPLDSVLSAFSHRLTHGYLCAYALESAADHYKLVAELVEHYRAQVPLNYLPVRYEDMIENAESTLRRILDFVGLPFESTCLHFEQNRRHARTASYAQVSESLYDRSCYRYLNYMKQLAPAASILRPILARLGYDFEA